ncbi:MAG: hypothetical protein H7A43_00810 [Verrucomicrobia bacterium]|nr:hypothetical protein [Verrucomicrobiota bacterium]
MKIIRFLSVFLIVIPSAYARIGESFSQSIERYGQPQEWPKHSTLHRLRGPETGNAIFTYKNWRLRIGYYQNRASSVVYNKAMGKAITQKISDEEFKAILRANEEGEWKPTPKPLLQNPVLAIAIQARDGNSWTSPNGLAAYWNKQTHSVRITDPEALGRLEAVNKAIQESRKDPIPDF